jgi:lipoprotein LprG
MYRLRLCAISFLVLLPLMTTACRNGDDGESGSNEDVTAESLLAGAREQWADTETAHFVLDVEGEAFLDSAQTIRLRSAEGDIARPDSMQASARIDVSVLVVDISLVAVGGDIYMTNFVSGRWERAPGDFRYDPSILFSDTEGIGPILTELQNPELGATEQIDGQETRIVTGTVDAATVQNITAGAIQGESIPVSVWIATDEHTIHRVVLTEPEGVREVPATWTLNLSNHNAPVTIEPPAV